MPARLCLAKAGIEKQWMGFPGHFVGLATHDVLMARGPIKAGQVVTGRAHRGVSGQADALPSGGHHTSYRCGAGEFVFWSGEGDGDVEKLVGSAK